MKYNMCLCLSALEEKYAKLSKDCENKNTCITLEGIEDTKRKVP
jgi:hypothetical protein